jgi:hypothetical protein
MVSLDRKASFFHDFRVMYIQNEMPLAQQAGLFTRLQISRGDDVPCSVVDSMRKSRSVVKVIFLGKSSAIRKELFLFSTTDVDSS